MRRLAARQPPARCRRATHTGGVPSIRESSRGAMRVPNDIFSVWYAANKLASPAAHLWFVRATAMRRTVSAAFALLDYTQLQAATVRASRAAVAYGRVIAYHGADWFVGSIAHWSAVGLTGELSDMCWFGPFRWAVRRYRPSREWLCDFSRRETNRAVDSWLRLRLGPLCDCGAFGCGAAAILSHA